MVVDCRRVNRVLVGLDGVEVVEAEETVGGLVVGVRLVGRPRCGGCGGGVLSKGWKRARLVDQPCFGRLVMLVWSKRRWECPDSGCGVGSFTEQDPRVAPVRARLTSRAARWATRQVGRGRTVSGAAEELGCDWHTVSKEVNRWGEALLEADRDRVGMVEALGLDETLFLRQGPRRRRMWITAAVDIRNRRLIDVFPGKDAKGAVRWLLEQPAWRREKIRWATLDLSGAYRAAYQRASPQAVQIADPFHVVRLANLCLDRVRRRVQEETLGRRGRKGDDLYRIRKLLTLAHERLDPHSEQKLTGLLQAGDPRREVRDAWHANAQGRVLLPPYFFPNLLPNAGRRPPAGREVPGIYGLYVPPPLHQVNDGLIDGFKQVLNRRPEFVVLRPPGKMDFEAVLLTFEDGNDPVG